MAWNNGPPVLYHGCDDASARSIVSHGVDLTKCKPFRDFGQGFYTTTSLAQAKNWANIKCGWLSGKKTAKNRIATVIRFDVDRDQLATAEFLAFVTEVTNTDFWDFVKNCRQEQPPGEHRRIGGTNYDVVFGPVAIWRQTLVIKDCDQISFHTDQGIKCLGSARVEMQQNQTDPLFP